jgi:hypothetical protein
MLKLDTDTLTKVLKLGAKIKKLLGRDNTAASDEINPAQLLGP